MAAYSAQEQAARTQRMKFKMEIAQLEYAERLRMGGGDSITPSNSNVASELLLDEHRLRRTVSPWWNQSAMTDFPGVRCLASSQYCCSGKQQDTIFLLRQEEQESVVQGMSAVRFGPIFAAAAEAPFNLTYFDTHDTPWLRGPSEPDTARRAPDFVLGIGSVLEARLVAIVGEFKNAKDDWDQTDVGRLLGYLLIILAWQPQRPFAVGIIIGGSKAQAFKVQRIAPTPTNPKGLFAVQTDLLDFSIPAQSRVVAGFFTQDALQSGFQLFGAPNGELLGTGSSGAVFDVPGCGVVKVAFTGSSLSSEREVLRSINAAGADGGFLQLAADDDAGCSSRLKLTPRFLPLQWAGAPGMSVQSYCRLLLGLIRDGGQLRLLHARGFVHGDVRPSNIMQASVSPGGEGEPAAWQAVLVDFGAARAIADRSPLRLGTIGYASDRALEALKQRAQDFQLLPADDVESLCRCFMAAAGSHPPHTTHVETVLAYRESHTTAGETALLQACRHPTDYDAVIEHVTKWYCGAS